MVYKGIVKTKGFPTPVWHTFALRNSKNDCGLTKGALVTLDCLLPNEEETVLSVFYHQIPFLVESEHLDTDDFTLRREGWHTISELSRPEIEHLLQKNTPHGYGFVLLGPDGQIFCDTILKLTVFKNKKGKVGILSLNAQAIDYTIADPARSIESLTHENTLKINRSFKR